MKKKNFNKGTIIQPITNRHTAVSHVSSIVISGVDVTFIFFIILVKIMEGIRKSFKETSLNFNLKSCFDATYFENYFIMSAVRIYKFKAGKCNVRKFYQDYLINPRNAIENYNMDHLKSYLVSYMEKVKRVFYNKIRNYDLQTIGSYLKNNGILLFIDSCNQVTDKWLKESEETEATKIFGFIMTFKLKGETERIEEFLNAPWDHC